MKIGLFLWGVLWLLVGGLVSFLGCFVDETCEYSSLIAPLPGILFIYLSLRKPKSTGEEKSLIEASSFYLKAFLSLLSIGFLVFVEIQYFKEIMPFLSLSILFSGLGVLMIKKVLRSLKTDNITIHREGVIGHGFHEYSSSEKFKFRSNQILYTLVGFFLLFMGLYSLYGFFVKYVITLF